jgi:CD109 antigen
MMGMVPNIYLLKYLNGKGVSLPDIEKTAKKYMKIGYDREQKFRFPDGSYSVWGPKSDDTGSMWLTSFVVKAFVQASQYIEVDKKNVMQSIYWILRQQGEDGCFQNKGYALHQELKGDSTSLSASVLVTLIEAKQLMGEWESEVPIPPRHSENFDTIIEKTYQCVMKNTSNNDNQNIYLQSMATYASILYENKINTNGSNPNAGNPDNLVNSLISAANTTMSGKLFWTTGKQNKARDVEITAYNVLSLTLQNKLSEALKAIRWLATNRNSYGGFVSTQDTMVALQAMSEYSLKISSKENDLNVKVGIGNPITEQNFAVDEDNKLILQKEKIGPLSLQSDVTVTASGTGCFMVQTILKYNIQDSPNKQAFNLVVTQNNENLTVCANYTGNKETDMVVIEIELLSGYTPYLKSLEKLFKPEGIDRYNDINYAPVKKYEYDEKERKIILYYDEMLRNTNCYYIELKKTMDIQEIKPAIATIYDYYNSKNTFSTSYNI